MAPHTKNKPVAKRFKYLPNKIKLALSAMKEGKIHLSLYF